MVCFVPRGIVGKIYKDYIAPQKNIEVLGLMISVIFLQFPYFPNVNVWELMTPMVMPF